MSTTDAGWLDFDIPGVLGLRVSTSAPAAERLRTTMAGFAVDQEVPEDIVLRGELELMLDAALVADELVHNASAVHFRRRHLQVVTDGDRYRLNGPGAVDALLPVLDLATPSRGAAVVHAASIGYHGGALALPAAPGIALSGAVASLAGRPGYSLMGHSWALLLADGRLLGVEVPTLTDVDRSAYGKVARAARVAPLPPPVSRSLDRFTELIRPGGAKRATPVACSVGPPQEAPLLVVAFVERYEGARTRVAKRDRAWMVQRLLGDFTIQQPRACRDVQTGLAATSHLALGPFLEDKARVVEASLAHASCFAVQVPAVYDPGVVSDEVVRGVEDLLRALVAGGKVPSGVSVA